VAQYLRALDDHENGRAVIADGVHRRFSERYLGPITDPPSEQRHGFAMMAVACLMIEALQSFRCGWPDTHKKGEGKHAFCSLFDEHPDFSSFHGYAGEFYKSVRCGILHQAETTNGWRIRRDQAELLTRTSTGFIVPFRVGLDRRDAKRFADKLRLALDHYCDQLKAASWDDELWKNLRDEMKTVCANCESISKNVA
jgi:hypothetical protein